MSDVHYADCDGADVAYRTTGDGPVDLVSLSSLLVSFEAFDDNPHTARFDRRLASFARLIQIDLRGIGLSDIGDRPLTVELIAGDILAVLDAVSSERAVLLAVGNYGPFALQAAATAPERVHSIVLVNAYAACHLGRRLRDRSPGADGVVLHRRQHQSDVRRRGGARASRPRPDGARVAPRPALRELVATLVAAGGVADDRCRFLAMTNFIDVRPVLPAISAPALVISRADDRLIHPRMSRYLAEHIAGARLVELPGADHVPFAGDSDALTDEIEEFVTGTRSGSTDRVLTTLLFSDIVDSTQRATELGDRRLARAELDVHDAAVRTQLHAVRRP